MVTGVSNFIAESVKRGLKSDYQEEFINKALAFDYVKTIPKNTFDKHLYIILKH